MEKYRPGKSFRANACRCRKAGPGRSVPLAFPGGGKVLACSQTGQALAVWDVATGAERGTEAGHKAFVGALAYSADGKALWSAGVDGTLIQWDAAKGTDETAGRNL